jgi:hypothetical protein
MDALGGIGKNRTCFAEAAALQAVVHPLNLYPENEKRPPFWDGLCRSAKLLSLATSAILSDLWYQALDGASGLVPFHL